MKVSLKDDILKLSSESNKVKSPNNRFATTFVLSLFVVLKLFYQALPAACLSIRVHDVCVMTGVDGGQKWQK